MNQFQILRNYATRTDYIIIRINCVANCLLFSLIKKMDLQDQIRVK